LQTKLRLASLLCIVCVVLGCGESDRGADDSANGTGDADGGIEQGLDTGMRAVDEPGDGSSPVELDGAAPDSAQSSEPASDATMDAGSARDAAADASAPFDAVVDASAPFDAGVDATPPFDGAVDAAAPIDAAVDAGSDAGRAADAAADATIDASGGADAGPPVPSALPSKGGTCPDFVSGDANFSPTGVTTRKVRLWVGTSGGGPLVLYWHSTNNQPIEAETTALNGVIAQITAAGGVVAAPYTGANDGAFPWLSTTNESLKIADEVVACAIEKKSIDARRIHVIGFSAGGLMTSTMSFQRSNYVASVVTYSGGLQTTAMFQDASNKFAALIFHGGSSDTYSILNFQSTSMSYSTALRQNGNYTALCNHGGGHAIPSAGPVGAWRFFQDHPYKTAPSPYVAGGLAVGIPSYCQTQP
jgi:hypothetical protein